MTTGDFPTPPLIQNLLNNMKNKNLSMTHRHNSYLTLSRFHEMMRADLDDFKREYDRDNLKKHTEVNMKRIDNKKR